MRYYIIAGERSGDLHGANFIKALKQYDKNAEIRCWGGDLMREAGGDLVMHYDELAVMGFLEVLKNIRKLRGFMKFCQQDLLSFAPDVLIMIDYGGFNLRMAKFAKSHNIKTFYYISPKVWAWKQSRALKIKAVVDKMFVILPFEKSFFRKFDYEVDYVGNPLLDAVREFQPDPDFKANNDLTDKPIIAILPGSRRQEIDNILTSMMSIVDSFPDYHFVVAGISTLPPDIYQQINEKPSIKIIYDRTYDLLSNAEAAIVTSGTATLETALFEVPQVVCYKTSAFTYAIAKRLVKVAYISLVNLIADQEVVKELIQSDLNQKNLEKELNDIIISGRKREGQLKGYKRIKEILGNEKASENLARLVTKYLAE
ncbi:lipid-A-disaccharide synthase [Fulvivirgaceae bacterium BMA10]|uniref:Lipid-A-disaccharide synthase n=1 Tax=Splendidivirga corallicola TaxID=3051826 RepID=A0ABT8KUY0_9BACT|nr:lipid-A-disaccharide synthase [Fulvivirgaceae bacterium BMA10]